MINLEDTQAELFIEALKRGQTISFIALGGSMRPWIPTRSRVTVEAIHPSELRWGEVALAVIPPLLPPSQDRSEGPLLRAHSWVLHRIITNDRQAKLIHTMGDRLPLPDPPRPYPQVLGVLSHIETEDGRAYRVSPRGLIFRVLGILTIQFSMRFQGVRRVLKGSQRSL